MGRDILQNAGPGPGGKADSIGTADSIRTTDPIRTTDSIRKTDPIGSAESVGTADLRGKPSQVIGPNQNRRFGRYLRKIREDRRLSLDAVEERSFGFPGRVTKSHLSRIETGQAIPTFPRMFTLSRIYGVPITQLAERFDLDLRTELFQSELAAELLAQTSIPGAVREQLASSRASQSTGTASSSSRSSHAEWSGAESTFLERADANDPDPNDSIARARSHIESGRYSEAMQLLDAAQVAEEASSPERQARIQLGRITCLLHLSSYHSAKDEAEQFLSRDGIPLEQRISGLYHLAQCGYRLGRFPVAELALREAERRLADLDGEHPHHAMLLMLRGNLAIQMDRPGEAVQAYREAAAKYEQQEDGFEACRTRLNLTSALIQTGYNQEAKRQLVRIVEKSRQQGWDRLTALALSNLALIAFTAKDYSAAEAYCLQSNTIARSRDYLSVVFRNCFYLWKIAREQANAPTVRTNFRTLKTYLNRLEDALPEAEAFRAHLARSES